MVLRTDGDQSIVLEVEGERLGVTQYSCFQAPEPVLSRNVLDAIPPISSNTRGQLCPGGAFIGVPLTYRDGEQFGTLCAVDLEPQPKEIEGDLPLVEMVGRMLSGVLTAELRTVEAERHNERQLSECYADPITGLFNRQGWERMLRFEEEHCVRYGNSAFLVLADLDGLKSINRSQGVEGGDKLLRRTAKVLRKTFRNCDVVARIGIDEFGILGTPCNPVIAEELLRRVRKELERGGIRASLGMATRVPALHLADLWSEAEQAMNGEKTTRKLRRTANQLRTISRSRTYPFDSATTALNSD
jgi:diguanylate cyclase (GGDEF)-like protein